MNVRIYFKRLCNYSNTIKIHSVFSATNMHGPLSMLWKLFLSYNKCQIKNSSYKIVALRRTATHSFKAAALIRSPSVYTNRSKVSFRFLFCETSSGKENNINESSEHQMRRCKKRNIYLWLSLSFLNTFRSSEA